MRGKEENNRFTRFFWFTSLIVSLALSTLTMLNTESLMVSDTLFPSQYYVPSLALTFQRIPFELKEVPSNITGLETILLLNVTVENASITLPFRSEMKPNIGDVGMAESKYETALVLSPKRLEDNCKYIIRGHHGSRTEYGYEFLTGHDVAVLEIEDIKEPTPLNEFLLQNNLLMFSIMIALLSTLVCVGALSLHSLM